MKFLIPFFAAFALFCGHSSAADSKPNIIFVMADDMGWGQTGYRGHPVLKTPNLDAMAANGLRFERFYAGNPVCSPTRASVLTGRSNERTGVLTHGYALRLQEKTIAQALKGAGYVTAHFGKWHLNGYKGPGAPVLAEDPRNPGAFGFDEWISATNFIDMDPYLGRNGVPEKFTGDSSELIVAEAGKFLEKHRAGGKPMFAVIWYGTPHSPFRASDADKAAFGGLNEASANHHGELVALDRSIGTLRQKLRDLGLAENTLLVFNSDNGGLPEIQPNTTGGLRGNKGQVYEGGLRVPGIMEWPAVIKQPRVTSYPASTMDLFPTVADIVGLPTTAFVQPVDGASLKPLLTAEIGPRVQPIGFRFGTKTALVDNRHKIITNNLLAGPFEVYDLEADPNETKNLGPAQPELLTKLKKQLLAFNESVDGSFAGKDYPEGKVTPPDPKSISWQEAPIYQPWLAQWKDYWAYKAALNRAAARPGNPAQKQKE
jgi:arylsulfatase A-like enzyme